MNQAGPQGPQAPGMPAGAQATAPNRPVQLFKPEQMRNISLLTEEEKTKYEKGLAQLWRIHDSNTPGSQENMDAKKKIFDFSKMLTTKIQQRRQNALQQQAQNQQQQAGQGGQQAQPNAVQQPQNRAAPGGQNPVQPQRQAGPGAGGPGTGAAAGPIAGATPAANVAVGASPVGPQGLKLPDHILNHLNQMNFMAIAPPQLPDKAKWVLEVRTKYARGLLTMESTRQNVAKMDQTIKDRNEKGNPLTPEEQKNVLEKKTQWQKGYQDAHKFVDGIQKQVRSAQQNAQQPNGGAGGGPQGGAGAAPMPNSTASVNTAAVNEAIAAAKNQQAAAGRMPGANGLSGPQQPPPAPGPNAQAQPGLTPNSQLPAGQQANQQKSGQAPVKLEPGVQNSTAVPAPLNTAIASAGVAGGLPSAGTPTQNSARVPPTPQTATPTRGEMRPLSHAAALTLANQRTGSGPVPTGGTPSSSAGVIGAAQPGHTHAHPGQTVSSKLPIPKVLPERATQIPTPVMAGIGGPGSGRPTYSGGSGLAGGVMGQPAIARTPAYQLEGEGERVLNKKKLDELVRQVCGGTAEGQEGNLLTPEVEESVLNLADSFVDNVLHTACRNAKERGSKVLEIRDIQLVLERTYNIRIPGYSTDELRTVRKIQPGPAWITKMSAVQAAKVMPGKGDL